MKYLVTADLHLRPDPPRCRLDKNWEETMKFLLTYLVNFAKAEEAQLMIIGDIYNASQVPAWLTNMFLSIVDEGTVFAGNHDFKFRNLEELESSSIAHILKNPRYEACVPEKEDGFFFYTDQIALCHRLVFSPEQSGLAKFKNGISCGSLVEMAQESSREVRWIFIGDNHHKFHYEGLEGVHVINPGSPMVYSAGMIGEECGFYIVDTETEEVTFHQVPDDASLVTDKYLREEESRSESIREVVATMEDLEVKTMDFFERNDEKAEEQSEAFKRVYEEIKLETLQVRSKLGKGE